MTDISRRAFTFSLAAVPAATFAAGLGIGATTTGLLSDPAPAASPPVARIKIGRFEVTALTDGYTDMPFDYFTGTSPEVIAQASASRFNADGGIRLSFNQYLVRDGDQLVLIDTGPASIFNTTGALPSALDSVGVKPEDIDAIIVTHLHMDHISGLVAGGRKVFPNAEVYADVRDVNYWTDPAKRASAPDYLKSSFDASAELVRLYPKLNRTDGEREIARGISIVDLTGHTPGHIGVRIADEGENLVMISDMLFHPTVHPDSSDVGFIFEQDPAAAREMRQRFFPRAAEEKSLIAATHLPFPGLGRIAKDEGRLRWVSADWAHTE